MSNDGVHIHHCCVIHGCKYGDPSCPVVLKKKDQAYTCEDCEFDYPDRRPQFSPERAAEADAGWAKLTDIEKIIMHQQYLRLTQPYSVCIGPS